MPASSKPPASAPLNRKNTNWETLSFEIGNELGKTKNKPQPTIYFSQKLTLKFRGHRLLRQLQQRIQKIQQSFLWVYQIKSISQMNLTVTDSLTTVAAALQLALKRQATGMEVIITAQNLKLFYVLTSLPLKRKKSFLILIPIL